MTTITIEVPDELALKLDHLREHLPALLYEVLNSGSGARVLRRLGAGASNQVYDEMIDFLASGPTPEQVIAHKISEPMQERLAELLEKNREEELSEAENAELDVYELVNHVMSLLKARTRGVGGLPRQVMPDTVGTIIKDRKVIYGLSDQTTVAEAARYLKDRGIRAAGVFNHSGQIVGIISQKDISDKVVAENYRPSEMPVLAIASRNLVKVSPDTKIGAAVEIMREKNVYHVIVEDAEGKFLGMVSLRDCVLLSSQGAGERERSLTDYALRSTDPTPA